MGSGVKRKKKIGMGDYLPTPEETKAMLWCIDNRVCKISPLAAAQGNANKEWYLEIYTNGKWNKSPDTFGPVEVWEKLFEYYMYYYNKYNKDE